MRIGDICVAADWLTGTETADEIEQAHAFCKVAFQRLSDQKQVLFGPIQFSERHPGDEGVGSPPDNIKGPDVRLLVGEAKVLRRKPQYAPPDGFHTLLDAVTLQDMRAATRRGHKAAHKRSPARYRPLTDDQCDRMIDEIGPVTVERMLREARDGPRH